MIDVAIALADLLHHEGCVNHMYQDSRGNVTVGIGELVPNVEAATKMPFMRTDSPHSGVASAEEITADFIRVTRMENGHAATYYRAFHPPSGSARDPVIEMTNDTCESRVVHRLGVEFFPGIVRIMPKFATFPLGAQRAIVDMAWSLGISGLAKFHVFLTDCNRGDFRGAAFESHRKGGTVKRNTWTKQMLLQAAGGDTT